MADNKISKFEKILTREIGIEFKCCMYFFCILFFYCVYRLCCKEFNASILHITEMICLTYTMGYIQVYLLKNFDESEYIDIKLILRVLLCTAIYTTASYFCNWFNKKLIVEFIFLLYMIFIYSFVFAIYKIRRHIDEKILNEDLLRFQNRINKDSED